MTSLDCFIIVVGIGKSPKKVGCIFVLSGSVAHGPLVIALRFAKCVRWSCLIKCLDAPVSAFNVSGL